MPLTAIKAEALRFLSVNTPEVLCIKGKWGVGKTFGWRTFLREAKENNTLALKRYAYVSLFGLNSLDDLRYALYEHTVTDDDIGKDADTATFNALIKRDNITRQCKFFIDIAASMFNRKGLADIISKATFLAIRNQLICIDDLERAGPGLSTREVLGLASMLKEERNCKVVLLLNDEEHKDKKEFENYLEKVADVTLRLTQQQKRLLILHLLKNQIRQTI